MKNRFVSANNGRVRNATEALRSYRAGDRYDRQSNVVDLLADLRHYCDEHDLTFSECDRIAHDHYTEEVVEARKEVL